MSSDFQPEVSVIVPARNEQDCLADCLRSLIQQHGPSREILVVDDHSTDSTRRIAKQFPVTVIAADPLPPGWSGKCNAVWTGAKAAKGKWLLFTDADTRHAPNSISTGLEEARRMGAALLSYSPKQEVHSFAERALMPVIFAELAATYRPKGVSDPNSPAAAANGQYLLIRREAYEAVGGHAAVPDAILEDVELAKRVKRAGYRLQFRQSDVVGTRMYRTFPQMWEGWTKNLALLFPDSRELAARRMLEFLAIGFSAGTAASKARRGEFLKSSLAAGATGILGFLFFRRIRRAHFDSRSNALAYFGLPLFSLLLLNSDISHNRGTVNWKGRSYRGGSRPGNQSPPEGAKNSPSGTYNG